jgi:hypothetical protein
MVPPVAEQGEERRSGVRRACHRPCLVRFARTYLDGRPGSVGIAAMVVDLSSRGLGLVLRFHLPPGAEVTVSSLADDRPALPAARVVYAAATGRRWHHGCTLVRRLTDEELRAWLD